MADIPLLIPGKLNHHLTRTRDELIELALINIDALRARELDRLSMDFSLSRTDLNRHISYEPVKTLYELSLAVGLLSNITKAPSLPRDIISRGRIAQNVLDLIRITQRQNIGNFGSAVDEEGETVDMSLAHLVKVHKDDLMALADQIIHTLPAGGPDRIRLSSELADIRGEGRSAGR